MQIQLYTLGDVNLPHMRMTHKSLIQELWLVIRNTKDNKKYLSVYLDAYSFNKYDYSTLLAELNVNSKYCKFFISFHLILYELETSTWNNKAIKRLGSAL